jgi:MarR family 2-MHQ and catechol resistance regulon transcriptional repressor
MTPRSFLLSRRSCDAARRDAPARRVESLAVRTLLSVARQRKGLDAPRCQVVFEHLDVALSVRSALHRTLSRYRVSDLQFGVLVALFALDPEPVMPADLADYTAVSRAAITDAVVRLESLELVTRTRDHADRRVFHLHLTEKGRTTVDEALNEYLSAVAKVARYVEPGAQTELLSAYERLQRGAADLAL